MISTAGEVIAISEIVPVVVHPVTTELITDLETLVTDGYCGIIFTVQVSAVDEAVAVVIKTIAALLIASLMLILRRSDSIDRHHLSSTRSGRCAVAIVTVHISISIVIDAIETEATLAVLARAHDRALLTSDIITVSESILIVV